MNLQVMKTIIIKNEILRIWIETKEDKMCVTGWEISNLEDVVQ